MLTVRPVLAAYRRPVLRRRVLAQVLSSIALYSWQTDCRRDASGSRVGERSKTAPRNAPITVTAPSEGLNVPKDQRDDVLRRELASSRSRERVLSFGNARELAGLSRREFRRLLSEREIDRHDTSEEFDEDLRYSGQ